MAWACMVFIDHVTADTSGNINSGVYGTMYCSESLEEHFQGTDSCHGSGVQGVIE